MPNSIIIDKFNKLILEKEAEIKKLRSILKSNEEGIDIKELKKKITGLSFKIRHLKSALSKISKHGEDILEGKNVEGLSDKMIKRVDEILKTGTLEEIQGTVDDNSSFNEKQMLEKITGIGPSKSDALLKDGITFNILMNELKKIDNDISRSEESDILSKLTHHQLIGLKYFDDIEKRIPREEIVKLERKLKRLVKQIDDKLEVNICGSYRRKKLESGDMDVLILHPNLKTDEEVEQSEKIYLLEIVEHLSKKKFLIDHLTESGKTKYMGLCQFNKNYSVRRIDIRFIPYNSKAAAMLYFTGSGKFNTVMRAKALKLGYTISEYGIKKKGGKFIETQNEKDIFNIIDMNYLEPEDRS